MPRMRGYRPKLQFTSVSIERDEALGSNAAQSADGVW
jgi:hypothetical protein